MKKIDLIRISFIAMLGIALFTISLNAGSSGADIPVSAMSNEYDVVEVIETTEPNIVCEPSQPIELSEPIESISEVEAVEYTSSDVVKEPASEYYIQLTEDEIYEFATLVFLEAGCESYECQLGVASVVINRMTTKGLSLYDVIYAPNQFTPADLIPYYEPSESTINAVMHVVQNGPTLPEWVTFFRANYYHSFSGVADYVCIDKTYFSYDISLKNKLDCEV